MLFIRSNNNATSHHYHLEVVIANSTIRAERTTGSGAVYTLTFSSVRFTNANMLAVFGCIFTAIGAGSSSSALWAALHLQPYHEQHRSASQ